MDADGLSACLEDLELNSLLRQVGGFVAAFSEGGMPRTLKPSRADIQKDRAARLPNIGGHIWR